jgi:hypothetical protein
MVPETGVEADHNWPKRMTMTTTNVEILRQGWLDAASALAPGLENLPESLENGLEAAVVDERLDEQSLLRVVTEVTSTAADSLPAEELYFLSRRLQRAVYEYLLSLDALPEPPPRRDGANGRAAADATLIGAEEVAALGRYGSFGTTAEPAHELEADAHQLLDPGPEPETGAVQSPGPEPGSESELEPEHSPVVDSIEAGLAELDSQLGPDYSEPDAPVAGQLGTLDEEVASPAETEPVAAAASAEPDQATAAAPAETDPAPTDPPPAPPEPSTRPAFTLFRRTGAKSAPPPVERNGQVTTEPADAEVTESGAEPNGQAPAQLAPPESIGSEAPHSGIEGEDEEPFVAPRDGFHLSDLSDFAVVQRAAKAPSTPGDATEPEQATAGIDAEALPGPEDQEAPNAAAARGWKLRDGEAEQGPDAGPERSAEDDRFETDPEVVEARLEINDRLRRKRCDEAAALLQRLANDVGGRALAELALDAGDRCRSLGKGNAALSCYLAASRADPVHETPLLRLADICMDDHDIDLAVSYLERVTRLRRLRNDDKGALKLYRKIVTIAPYRDDILAMLMRAQASGRFDE